MAARGNVAKANLINKIIEALPNEYAGNEDNKKYYFNSYENGETVQVCITMTCPKVPFGTGPVEPVDAFSAPSPHMESGSGGGAAAISEADKAKIEELKRKLGIINSL